MGGLGSLELNFGTEPFPSGQGEAAKGPSTNPALDSAMNWGWQDATAGGQGLFLGVQCKLLDLHGSQGWCSFYPLGPGSAQARAEASNSTWRMLCLPTAPSPGDPSAAVAKTTAMFVIYVLQQAASRAGGTGVREEDLRLTAQ